MSPKFFCCATLSHINVAISAPRESRPCRWLAVAYRARRRRDLRPLVLFGCLSNPLCKIETARENNHRSCLAVPLCKLSGQPFGTDHEGPDQAQPRPLQPPVARAVRGHQDTREPGSRSEKFSAESRPLGETITDPVSQPHYASCLASPSQRTTKAQVEPSHALGSPLWRARQQQT